MYKVVKTPAFKRDVKACRKKHWDMEALRETIEAIRRSDTVEMDPKYRVHVVKREVVGGRLAAHVPSFLNPGSGIWVIVFEVVDTETVLLIRIGTHDSVY